MICHLSKATQKLAIPELSENFLRIPEQYLDLLCAVQPRVIEDEAECQRINVWIDAIEQLGDNASDDQLRMLRLLSFLVQGYEDKYIKEKWSSPEQVLERLLHERGLQRKDILHIFGGHRSNLSAVMSGKRSISVSQAKKLGDLFKVPFSLFL